MLSNTCEKKAGSNIHLSREKKIYNKSAINFPWIEGEYFCSSFLQIECIYINNVATHLIATIYFQIWLDDERISVWNNEPCIFTTCTKLKKNL